MFCGWMVWFSFVTWRLAHPEVAVLAGIVSVFVCEATIHRAERKGLQRERLQLRQQLNLSSYNISQLQESLSNVQAELHRRDIIGTPAARELLKRQEEAMNAQSSALEAALAQSEVTATRHTLPTTSDRHMESEGALAYYRYLQHFLYTHAAKTDF